MRIANAQLRKNISYYPQRTALAGKMYVRWLKRKQQHAILRIQKGKHSS